MPRRWALAEDGARPADNRAAPLTVRVKICGITRVEDALAAERAGADAVGFVFAAGSKRLVTPEQAAEASAALGPFVARVGVFVNAGLAEVERATKVAGLTAVQLHGAEDEAFITALAGHVPSNVKVIRAVTFGPGVTPEAFAAYPADAVLLDATVPGSGRAFDWYGAAAWRGHPRMVLAGGLAPSNVAAAVRALRPFGVDVSSGVETAPGIKSTELITRFVQAARAPVTG